MLGRSIDPAPAAERSTMPDHDNGSNEGRARALADRYWEDLLRIEPLLGTEVGDERFDDRLSDPSEAGQAERRSVSAGALEQLSTIDRPALEPVLRGTLDILEAIAGRDLANLDAGLERLEAVSHMWGPGQLLAAMAGMQRADSPERLERYVARLRALPAYLDAYGPIMRDGVATGVIAPEVVVDRTIAQMERVLAAGVDGSPAYLPVDKEDAGARAQVAAAVEDAVLPAYGRYLDALRAYRPHATATIGLSALPDGDAIYRSQILAWTTLALEPEDVHRFGLEELERIQEQRAEIAASLGFDHADQAIEALLASGDDVAATRQDMIQLVERQVAKSWEAAPEWFGRVPSANCGVKPVEEFREADSPAAFYQPASADGTRPGAYYVNTSDLPERPLHNLAAITYHEANPGHHFQITIEMEMPDRPALRRFGGILAGSAFIEGWGLYSERLADEIGLYEDQHERLGMLAGQAMRACRLILDTGIHAFGWDRQRAVAQMVEAGVAKLDAEIETDRYISLPGQALAYKIGQREIERWRADLAARAGSSFDIRGFHDRLLSLGSLPLPSLRRELSAVPSA
jgi:uncharacterized protein (DUF885 family)